MDYSTLKQQIVDEIVKSSAEDVNALRQLIKNKSANYQTVAEFSKVFGDTVSKCINKYTVEGITEEELAAFASKCLAPVYKSAQNTVLNACKRVQQLYNDQAGIGLKPVDVETDESRIQHIIERFNEASNYDEVEFLTNANVARSITRGAVQDSMRRNAKFHEDSGLNIRISRSDGSGCCAWCSTVVGTYDSFDALPDDFWLIHRGCSCVIDYKVGKTHDKIKYITWENGYREKVTESIE